MNVAKARYTGRMRSATRKTPQSNTYTFHTYTGEVDESREWVDIDDVDDARWLDEQSGIEVEWNPVGRLKAQAGDVTSALSEMAYNQKQKLVAELDLDIAGNSAEDDLEDAIREHVDEMHQEGNL